MTRDDIVAVFARRMDAINSRDLQQLQALYTPDCVVDSPMAAGTVQGRQAVTKIHQALLDGLPDLRLEQDLLLVDGDQAIQISTMTDSGGFMGLPPSGKTLRVTVVVACRFQDGLIVRERRIYDFTGMLVQIGVLKARPA